MAPQSSASAATSLPILIVADHAERRGRLIRFMEHRGRHVIGEGTVEAARAMLLQRNVAVAVLDWDRVGFSALRALRVATRAPIIVLSAHAGGADAIKALEGGADDYLPGPFSERELLARIDAVVRRAFALPPALRSGVRVGFGPWVLHKVSRELVGCGGQKRNLTTRECAMLLALLERPRVVLSRCQLLDIAFPHGSRMSTRAVDTLISRIRHKIKEPTDAPDMIRTAWGAGYLFTGDVERLDP
jgi:two-component system OmpR family response regulator